MLTIGEAIRKARIKSGYTKVQLAEIAHISFNTLHKWEKDETYPNLFNLIPIADALGVTLDELVGRTVKDNERN